MDEELIYIYIIVFSGVIYVIASLYDFFTTRARRKKILNGINEDSYQKYAKFYGDVVPSDDDFNTKLNNILNSIKKGETDIKEIAKNSHCTYPECVLKIRYLKNKRLIGDYFIDTNNLRIFPCSKEDEELLKKYKISIYKNHFSIDEIADNLYRLDPYSFTKEEYKDKIFEDLKYLDSKKLLNGIVLNEVDKTIKYYSIEKKKESDLVTVHCPNCGALNDLDVDSKTRCSYCNTIIVIDKSEKE